MSEIKINTGDINGVTKTAQKESVQVRTKELPDVRDVNSFQSLLSERVESDQKRDAKRDSKNNETNLKESGENVSVFTLLLGEKIVDNGVTVVSKEEKTVSEEKFFDPVSFVGANRRETEKSEKGGLDEPVGEKVLEHFERKLDGKIFSQTRIGENEIRERLFPKIENDLAKATAVKIENKNNEKIEGVQLLENESKEEKTVSEEKFFDPVASVNVDRGEIEKNEKGILDVPVGEKVLEHFERKLDDKIFSQTRIGENEIRERLFPAPENDLAKATAVKVEHKSNEKIEGVQLLENESKEEKIVSEEKFFDSVSSVGVGGETEKNEKGILDVPVGEKVLEHFERKLDDKIFPQTQIEEDGVRKKLSPKIENDLAKATTVKIENKNNEKIEGVQLLENESKEEKIVSEEKFFDSVSFVGVGGETEKSEKGGLDEPVGKKVLEHFERKLDDKIFPQTQIEEDGVRKKLSPKIENDLAKATAVKIENKNSVSVDAESKMSEKLTGRAIIHGYENIRKEEEIVPAKNFDRESVGKEKKEGNLQLIQLAKEQPVVVEEEEIVPAKNFVREDVGKEKKEGDLQLTQLAKEQPAVVEKEEIVPAKNFDRESVGKEEKEEDLQLTQLAKEQPVVVEKEKVAPARNFDRESVGKEKKEGNLQLTRLAKEQPVVVEKEKIIPTKNFDRESVGKEEKEEDLQLTQLAKEQPVVMEKSEVIEKAPLTIVSGEKVLETLGQISDTKIIAPAETISKIGYEIVERLMIAQSVNAVKQEVIIVFKENVLPGTQVSLVREKSELSLMFTTVNTQSMESLTAGQDGLRSFLFEQLKDITAIHIKFEERGSGDLSEKNPQKRQQNQQSKEENSENTSKK